MQNTKKAVVTDVAKAAYHAYISEGIADSNGNFIPMSFEAFKAQKHAELVATFAPEAMPVTDSRTAASVNHVAANGLRDDGATFESYEWSNRSFNPSSARPHNWTTFYYCQGAGFNAGHKVYYGRNDWSDEQSAIDAQERWEKIRRNH
jgi:hypothetical protein